MQENITEGHWMADFRLNLFANCLTILDDRVVRLKVERKREIVLGDICQCNCEGITTADHRRRMLARANFQQLRTIWRGAFVNLKCRSIKLKFPKRNP